MSRLPGILSIVAVVVLAMAFAAANAGNRVTLELGLITLYRAPVTLVAFSGLLVGMVVMFVAGIRSDLKVRRILRDRLAEETRTQQQWIDRNQRDLFAQEPEAESKGAPEAAPGDPLSEAAFEVAPEDPPSGAASEPAAKPYSERSSQPAPEPYSEPSSGPEEPRAP